MFESPFSRFYRRYPALYYALIQLIGTAIALEGTFLSLIPLAALLLSSFKRVFLAGSVLLVSLLYTQAYVHCPDLPKEGIQGTAVFAPTSVAFQQTLFGRNWTYRGTLQAFLPSGQGLSIARRLPCQIQLSARTKGKRPSADQTYQIVGTLKQTKHGRYFLSVPKDHPWQPIPDSWSLAEWRHQMKGNCKRYLYRIISHKQSASFLAGMVTGVFDDPLMTSEFARFGLQHIMAISGFHFSILATLLGFFCRFLFPQRAQPILLLVILTSYVAFLGFTPSILRAWIMLSLTLFATLIRRQSLGLNSLGIAISAILLYDPCLLRAIGFQFSVLIAGSILLFYPLFEVWLQEFFPKRSLSQVVEMSRYDQHFYLILCTFRQALALTCAVNVIAIPLTLFIFHKFPLLSLLYNLFFPFMVSIALFLLLLGIACEWICPPIAGVWHALTTAFTGFLLSFTSNLPPSLDFHWRIASFPAWILVVSLTCLFTLGIFLSEETQ